jgi:hypothetical protein
MTKDKHWEPSIFDNDLAESERFCDAAETEEAANIEVNVVELPPPSEDSDEESDYDEEPPGLLQRDPKSVGRRAFINTLHRYIDSDSCSSSDDECDSDDDSVRIMIQRQTFLRAPVLEVEQNDDKSTSADAIPGLEDPGNESDTSLDMPPIAPGTADDSSVDSDDDLGTSLFDSFETTYFNPITCFDHDIEQQWAIVMGHKYPT